MSEKPQAHNRFLSEFPELAAAYEQMGTAVHTGGPLDEKTRQLVKLALAVGIQHEGAVHAHTRRALGLGITPNEIKHVVSLAVTTLGLPATVAAYTWVNDILDGE
ncbi:MAG: carboxymuconolactone decarboxylase family protein [Anaerolineae bacterium]